MQQEMVSPAPDGVWARRGSEVPGLLWASFSSAGVPSSACP